jgi:hypothetical protein
VAARFSRNIYHVSEAAGGVEVAVNRTIGLDYGLPFKVRVASGVRILGIAHSLAGVHDGDETYR